MRASLYKTNFPRKNPKKTAPITSRTTGRGVLRAGFKDVEEEGGLYNSLQWRVRMLTHFSGNEQEFHLGSTQGTG